MIPILNTASKIQCPHGGTVILSTSNGVVTAGGSPALLVTDQHAVAGCPFTLPAGKPQPCVTVRWLVGATQTKVNGTPILLQSSLGMCFSGEQIPQGPPIVLSTQQTAKGT
jgi:hypothetical protein